MLLTRVDERLEATHGGLRLGRPTGQTADGVSAFPMTGVSECEPGLGRHASTSSFAPPEGEAPDMTSLTRERHAWCTISWWHARDGRAERAGSGSGCSGLRRARRTVRAGVARARRVGGLRVRRSGETPGRESNPRARLCRPLPPPFGYRAPVGLAPATTGEIRLIDRRVDVDSPAPWAARTEEREHPGDPPRRQSRFSPRSPWLPSVRSRARHAPPVDATGSGRPHRRTTSGDRPHARQGRRDRRIGGLGGRRVVAAFGWKHDGLHVIGRSWVLSRMLIDNICFGLCGGRL